MAYIEAHIDFEETDTLEEGLIVQVTRDVQDLTNELRSHLADGRRGEILRNGVKTIILGEPNVGKSSVLNLLCKFINQKLYKIVGVFIYKILGQRPAAIVTPIAGTTRDVLEVTLNIRGYPLVLADTAGLRSKTEDLIEREGIHRTLNLFEKSDLILLVIDAQKYETWKENNSKRSFVDYLREYTESLKLTKLLNVSGNHNLFTKECLIVINKTDLVNIEATSIHDEHVLKLSCKTEDGVIDLVNSIAERLKIM